MNELLPSPNITSHDEKGQVQQIRSYLFQLKEALEFILTNLGTDNFSVVLQNQLSSLGVAIEDAKTDADERQHATTKLVFDKQLTVADVVNSELFNLEMENIKEYVNLAMTQERVKNTKKLMEIDKSISDTLVSAKKYTDEKIAVYHPKTTS